MVTMTPLERLAAWCATLYLFHIVPWSGFGVYAGLLFVVELAQRRWRGPLFAALATLPSLANRREDIFGQL